MYASLDLDGRVSVLYLSISVIWQYSSTVDRYGIEYMCTKGVPIGIVYCHLDVDKTILMKILRFFHFCEDRTCDVSTAIQYQLGLKDNSIDNSYHGTYSSRYGHIP